MISPSRPSLARTLASLFTAFAMLLTGAVVAAPAHAAAGYTVSGTVTVEDGVDASGVWVELYEVTLDDSTGTSRINSASYVHGTYLGPGNIYEFDDLVEPGGTYSVRVYGGGSAAAWLGGTPHEPSAVWFTVDAAQTTIDLVAQLAGVLTVDVTDPDGEPMTGGWVDLLWWDDAAGAWVDNIAWAGISGGSFTVYELVPGIYTMRIAGLPSDLPDQYLGGVGALPVDASNPDQIVTVVAGSNTLPVQVDGGRTVSGTITAPETVDLEGLTVQLYRGSFADGEFQGGYTYLGTTTPSVAGTYELAGLTSGEYFTVSVSGPGVMEQFYDGATDMWDATWLPGDTDQSGVDFALDAAGSLSGTVLGPDGEPLVGVDVNAYLWGDGYWSGTFWGRTNDDGEYTIHGVPEGHYAMQYNTAGANTTAYSQYEGGSVDRPESPSDPKVRYVSLGASEPVTTTLVAGYAVSGTVSVPEGIGMGDVSIRLERLQVDESDPESPEVTVVDSWASSTTPDEDGTYTLQGMAPGETYAVHASATGVVSQYYDGVYPVEEATRFLADGPMGGVNFTLAQGSSLTGSLLGADGDPLVDFAVRAYRWAGDSWGEVYSAYTNSLGNYQFTDLPEGAYALYVETWGADVAGYSQYRGGSTEAPAGPDDVNVVEVGPGANGPVPMQLDGGFEVSGTVHAPEGVNMDTLEVALFEGYFEDGELYYADPVRTVNPDAEGEYTLSGLVPGKQYTVGVSGPGVFAAFYGGTRGAWDAGTEWFEAADLTGVDLTVEAAASLAGVVLGPDEELVSDAWINAYLWTDEGWEYLTSTGTDEHGEFEFTELEAGAYTFYFSTYGTNAYSQYLGGGTQLPNSSDGGSVVEVGWGPNDPITVNLLAGRSVSGTLHGIEDFDANDVEVTLYQLWFYEEDGEVWLDDWEDVRSVAPDSDGSYEITGLTPGRSYTLRVEGGGTAAQFLGGASSVQGATHFVADGDQLGKDFTLTSGGTLAGTVTGPEETLLEGVRVRPYVWDETQETWRSFAYGYTGLSGEFTFGDVLPGTYTFFFDTDEVVTDAHSQYLGGGRSLPEGPTGDGVVTLAAGESKPGNVQLVAGEVVTGQVIAPVGTSVEDLEVDVYEVYLDDDGGDGPEQIEDWDHITSAPVDSDGSFRVRGLEPGVPYTVRVSGGGLGTLYLGGAGDFEDADWFYLGDSSELVLDYTTVTRLTAQLTAAGDPVDDAWVELYRWTGSEWEYERYGSPDGDGKVSWTGLPAGIYTMWVDPNGAAAYSQFLGGSMSLPGAPTDPLDPNLMFEVTEGVLNEVTLPLAEGVAMSGNVTVPAGVAPSSVKIRAYRLMIDGDDSYCSYAGETSPDANGDYEFTGLAPGELHTLRFGGGSVVQEHLGGSSSCMGATMVEATAGGTFPSHVLSKGATVEGQLLDAVTSTSVTDDAEIELYRWNEDEQYWDYVTSDDTDAGEFSFRSVGPGTYTFYVYPYGDGHYSQFLGGSDNDPAPGDPAATFTVSGEGTVVQNIPLAGYRTVSGQITGAADPTALTVDLIQVYVDEDGIWDWNDDSSTTPLSDGSFEVSGMRMGENYTLRVSGPGIAPAFYDASGGTPDPYAADWWSGATDVTGKNLSVMSGHAIEVAIDHSEGTPPTGVWVDLMRWSEANQNWQYLGWADLDGAPTSATFPDLAPGKYTFQLYPWGSSEYPMQWAGGLPFAPDPSHPSVLEILPGSPATVYGELTLLRGGALEGALENTGGEGLEVTVHRDGKVVDYRWVDGDEPFSFSLLPGEYEVRVSRWDPDEEISVPLRTIPGVIVTAGGITDMDAIDMGDPGTTEVSIGSVSVTGTLAVGQVLTAGVSGLTPAGATLTYQWLRDGSEIAGATSSSYSVSLADVGNALAVRVTASVPGHTSATDQSAPTGSVPQAASSVALAASAPQQLVGGTPVTLTATVTQPAGATPGGQVSFTQDGVTVATVPVVDGTATYTLPGDLAESTYLFGAQLDPADTRVASSSAEDVDIEVIVVRLPDLDAPTITGTPALGQVLTASLATDLPAGTQLTYQWLRDGEAIPGATAATYTVAFADVSAQLQVQVTANLELAEPKSATSALTSPVPQATSSVALAASGTQQVLGGTPVTLTATVTQPAGVTLPGEVTFTWADGSQTVPVSDGEAQLELSSTLDVGSHTFTAAFTPGDGRVGPSTSSSVTVTVLAEAPVLPDLDAPTITGTPAVGSTLTATLATDLPDGAQVAYQWLRGGSVIPGATAATYAVTFADVGAQLAVRVDVTLELAEPKSATSAATVAVPQVASTVALAASGTQQVEGGTPVTLTATVTQPAGVTAPGTVTFSRGGAVLATVAVAAGKASTTLPADLAVGSHTFTAAFTPGDARVAGSSSAAVTVAVVAAPVVEVQSSVTLKASRAKQAFKGKKTAVLTATVTAPGASTAGRVVFKDGSKTLGTVAVAGGKATLTVKKNLKVGKHALTAQFLPADATVVGSTSSALTLTVAKAKAKITAKLVKKAVAVGARGQLRVTVKVTGIAKPKGKLVVYRGKKAIRTVKLKGKHRGQITVKLPRLAKGKHKLKVTYQGTKNIAAKTSKQVTLRVR